jgi:molybdenum cofactor synthesis domain-containing protein
MTRILGLYDVMRGEWDKLAYIHSSAAGETCVNGAASRIAIHAPGEAFQDGAGYAIVIPGSAPEDAGFIAVNSGELLLRIDSRSVTGVVNPGFAGVSARAEFWRIIRAGVLTVSDRAAAGERDDTSGAALISLIEATGAEVIHRDTVPDERDAIAGKLKEWADGSPCPELIMTTGGTGLSRRDITPEALTDVGERVVPGFGELMRSRSMLRTPMGCLSRSLAVLRGGTLIIALPGSETAVRQCFAAIAPSLRHGVGILNGWDSECGHGRG